MKKKKVIIIGGGMAGLSAGCYLQMNGYDTTIFEMNAIPGGVCTAWKRGNYTVDLCIHWLVGSGPGSSFYNRWNELIDMEEIRFVDYEEFFRVEDERGNYISVYSNLDKLEKEFLTKAPEDREEITEFMTALRKLAAYQMPTSQAQEVANAWDKMKLIWKMLPFIGTFGKYQQFTCRQYGEHFKNPLMKKVIEHLFVPDTSVIFGMIALTWLHNKTAGYPVGGSLNFAQKVYDRYQSLGGNFCNNSRVGKILVENNCSVGIELEDGRSYMADYVVSAADGYSTIFKMLNGEYVDAKLTELYEKSETFPSLVFVALGVNKDFSRLPRTIVFPLSKPLQIDPETKVFDISLDTHSCDHTLAPKGASLLTIMLETYNYDYWTRLFHEDKTGYEKEKDRIAKELIGILEERFKGIKNKVEMVDVSTPISFHNFSGNWKGSFEGWLMTPETGFNRLAHTLPGLNNFYMCGQWVSIGGGLPGVMLSGRDTAQIICEADKKAFEVHPQLSLAEIG